MQRAGLTGARAVAPPTPGPEPSLGFNLRYVAELATCLHKRASLRDVVHAWWFGRSTSVLQKQQAERLLALSDGRGPFHPSLDLSYGHTRY
jgi:hypothetical protein